MAFLTHCNRKTKNTDEAINIVQSIAKAKPLYRLLCTRCHPDKFMATPNLKVIAEELFKEVIKNRYNYSNLLELEKKIDSELY